MKTAIWFFAFAVICYPIQAASGGGADPWVGLADLPPEVAKVFADTLVPHVGLCETEDLDGDGSEEIVLFSGGPISAEETSSASATILFQSLLMVFEKGSGESGFFPYRLSVKKSVSSLTPNPVHLTLEDMGGTPNPELVWLQGGPDAEGRYSEAVVYSYAGDRNPPLVEMARFENPTGWVRIHDLDRDGVSEAIAFSGLDGRTVCPDLLFFQEDRWTSLQAEIQALGFADIADFQNRLGFETNGRVTRDLLLRYKSYRSSGTPPAPTPEEEDALGPIYE